LKTDFLKLLLKIPLSDLRRYENILKAVDSDGNSILHVALLMKNFPLFKVIVLILKRLSIPTDQMVNSKGETIRESAACLSKQMMDSFLDQNKSSTDVTKIGEIIKISRFLEETESKKNVLISQDEDNAKTAKLFDTIAVSS
jgi:hypothetical protein